MHEIGLTFRIRFAAIDADNLLRQAYTFLEGLISKERPSCHSLFNLERSLTSVSPARKLCLAAYPSYEQQSSIKRSVNPSTPLPTYMMRTRSHEPMGDSIG